MRGISAEYISDPVFEIEVPCSNEKNGVGIQLRGYKSLTDEFLVDLADVVSKNFPKEEIKLEIDNFLEECEKKLLN